MAPLHVLVMGHSFIRRLRDYVFTDGDNTNLRLQGDQFEVEFRAAGGLTIHRMASDGRFTSFERIPDIVFLQIGGNDLDNGRDVKTVTRDIISYGNFLVKGCSVQSVIIGQVIWRKRTNSYNAKVIELNNALKHWVQQHADANIIFHHHHGFWSSNFDFLSSDGVHIKCSHTDKRHMHKYMQSVKRAILRAANRLPG
ncbi:uncharacterized protein LOC133203116 [Saccostrea echinata]|uniref:uncharacterized protein LOC133203116 n=1 Tax=Saccostrea echinata TaxID=191078 RepID=UPI002A7EFDF5|nr:uncharacterized protein LOC133203116 [Saccostrea echinata]